MKKFIIKWKCWIVDIIFYCRKKVIKDRSDIFVATIEQTLHKIKDDNCSICRYGDGEIKWMFNLQQQSFQDDNMQMSKRLREILDSKKKDILICIPDIFGNMELFTKRARFFWQKHIIKYEKCWKEVLASGLYYNANITRPYMAYEKKDAAGIIFDIWKDIFADRSILIIEGEYTRFGVNNDLLSKAHIIYRILCPNRNAFEVYERIKERTLNFLEGDNLKEYLILIALGPTATIMAAEFAEIGFQAIDIGHLDIEYEWFRQKVTEKIPIRNKYVNEAAHLGGNHIGALDDETYLSQIITQITYEA